MRIIKKYIATVPFTLLLFFNFQFTFTEVKKIFFLNKTQDSALNKLPYFQSLDVNFFTETLTHKVIIFSR